MDDAGREERGNLLRDADPAVCDGLGGTFAVGSLLWVEGFVGPVVLARLDGRGAAAPPF